MAFSSGKSKTPSVALSDKKVGSVRTAIIAMEDKQIKLAKQAFTIKDLLHLFVRPDIRQTLCDAYDLCEPSGRTEEMFVRADVPAPMLRPGMSSEVVFTIFKWHRSNSPTGFYVPKREGAGRDNPAPFAPDAPQDLIDRFTMVQSDLMDIHWRFSNALWVLSKLNQSKVCSTLPQMRYVWPCIHTLMRKAKHYDDADAIAEPSLRAGEQANIPLDLRPWLQPTNDTIMRATLLDDVEDAGVKLPIEYSMSHSFPRN